MQTCAVLLSTEQIVGQTVLVKLQDRFPRMDSQSSATASANLTRYRRVHASRQTPTTGSRTDSRANTFKQMKAVLIVMLVLLYVLIYVKPQWPGNRSRQVLVAVPSAALSKKNGLITDLVYIKNPVVVAKLGCPVGREEAQTQFTCLYHFSRTGPVLTAPKSLSGAKPDQLCQSTHQPQSPDWGRTWCIRSGRKPAWLDRELPGPWPVRGTTLMTGLLTGPNPTHQLNLHFYHTFRWMQQANIAPGELDMIFDGEDEQHTLGTYGVGLADALARKHGMLRDLPNVTEFKAVKLSVGGGFQFDMNLFQTDSPVLCDYLRMAAVIKQHYGIKPTGEQEPDPRRVVIATRKETESRRLANPHDLAQAMRSMSWNVTVATFGEMTFEAQLRLVGNAKVLVGVSGSDLVSLLFMPLTAVVIEIFPLVLGTPVFCPELANQARNCGKLHRPYYSPYNATLFEDPETGQPIDARPIHQTKLVRVHVAGMISHIQGAVQAADASMFYGFDVAEDDLGAITTCKYDHKVPQGLLYNCAGQGC